MKTSKSDSTNKTDVTYFVVSVLIDGTIYFVSDVYANEKNVSLSTSVFQALKIDEESKAEKFAKMIMKWDHLASRVPSGIFIQKVRTIMEVLDTKTVMTKLY